MTYEQRTIKKIRDVTSFLRDHRLLFEEIFNLHIELNKAEGQYNWQFEAGLGLRGVEFCSAEISSHYDDIRLEGQVVFDDEIYDGDDRHPTEVYISLDKLENLHSYIDEIKQRVVLAKLGK